MKEEGEPAATAQQLQARLRELISAICLNEREEWEALLIEVQETSTAKLGLQEIIGLQLMQKISFVEAHLSQIEWMSSAVRQKKGELQAIWRKGIRDHARISRNYQC